MCNRKRRTAQPILEPMEPRVALSAMGIHAHHARAVPDNPRAVPDHCAAQFRLSEPDRDRDDTDLRSRFGRLYVSGGLGIG